MQTLRYFLTALPTRQDGVVIRCIVNLRIWVDQRKNVQFSQRKNFSLIGVTVSLKDILMWHVDTLSWRCFIFTIYTIQYKTMQCNAMRCDAMHFTFHISIFTNHCNVLSLKKVQEFDNKQLWLALHTYVSSLPRNSSETFRLTRQTSRLKSR